MVGLGALAAAAAAAFAPAHGHYDGPSTGGHRIAFHYAQQEIVGIAFGTVHACPKAWVGHDHEFTCHHNGKFVTGEWTSSTDVEGDYVYTRQSSRGITRITVHWTAHLKTG